MYKKQTIAIAITVLSAFILSNASAQNKKLTMEDAILNVKTTLAPKNLSQLNWVKNSENYYYVNANDTNPTLYAGSGALGHDEKIISLADINEKLKRQKSDTLAKFPTIEWKTDKRFVFMVAKNEYEYDLTRYGIYLRRKIELNEGAEKNDVDSVNGKIAYTVKNNLFIHDAGKSIQVTNDENENILNGSSVHRDEFGITKGTFWSPRGTKLAFYRMDQTMVADYPIVDWTKQPATVKNIKYPMAGGKSHEVTVGVYDVKTQTKLFLQTGEPKEQYLTNIAWSPDEKFIYIAVLNRDQNHMKLNRYSALTGAFDKTLFEEKDEKYTEPLHPPVFVPGNPNNFIWQSQRDGYNHLYLYDTDGKLIRQLTKGEFVVTDFKGFDVKAEKAVYMCTAISPLDRDLYSVTLAGAKMKRITGGDGTHTCMYNPLTSETLDVFSSTTTPRKITLIKPNGDDSKTLLNADNPLKDFALPSMKISSLKNANGDELFTRTYYPLNMDSSKKYPVIVYVYGGPHVQLITNTWQGGQGDLWFYYLAQEGFIVFTLDSRGSGNRGKNFEQAIFRNPGMVEMEDQMVGVNYLKTLPYVDATRIGVDGWSYGGFMTTTLMTRQPGTFKVAVAGGPVIDWSYYEIMYGERYFDTPQSNPDGYKSSNLLNYIGNLQGKLMLIHGTSDDTVVWQQSLIYLKKAVDLNKQVDYFVYPGHPHNVRGKDRVNLMNKITDYFKLNL